jgi:hypothetical protein
VTVAEKAAPGAESVSLTAPSEQRAELSDVELLRRAVTYSRPCGFGVIEKWRAVGSLFGLDAAVAQRLCKRFGIDPNELVAK